MIPSAGTESESTSPMGSHTNTNSNSESPPVPQMIAASASNTSLKTISPPSGSSMSHLLSGNSGQQILNKPHEEPQTDDSMQQDDGIEFKSGGPGVPPRKRSKVSRACDACRRKKVRCDAEFSSTVNNVSKICTNCSKNKEICTFSRVPLKRGPSKGYIRDLEEKIEYSKTKTLTSQIEMNQPPISQFGFQSNNLAKPTVTGPIPINSSNKPSIILPPINPGMRNSFGSGNNNVIRPLSSTPPSTSGLGINSASTGSLTSNSNPSSPKANGYMTNILNPQQPQPFKQTPDTLPQGHFWKVPYELPFNRRGSVDSLASSISDISSIKNQSQYPTSQYESSVVSDSDDDYNSQSNGRFSQSLSPRNSISSNSQKPPSSPALSISSLSSLNNKMTKTLNIAPAPAPVHIQPSPPQSQSLPPIRRESSATQLSPNTQTNIQMIETNLNIYYAKIHKNFPLLPFQKSNIISMIDQMTMDDQTRIILDIFNLSLQCVNKYSTKSLNEVIFIFNKIMNIYPFQNSGIKLNDSLLIFFLSSLALLNYSILLNGEIYSLGLALSFSIFNDYKVSETFIHLIKQTRTFNDGPKQLGDIDNIKLYLPKLLTSLIIIDNIYSLSFGVQKNQTSIDNYNLLLEHLPTLIPLNSDNLLGINNFKIGLIFSDLIRRRDEGIFIARQGPINWNSYEINNISGVPGLFMSLIREKYELVDYLKEIVFTLQNNQNIKQNRFDEEDEDIIQDFQMKLCRISKKISSSIINLLNNLSTISQSTNQSSSELVSPYLNLIYGQTFKLIILSKLLVDSLLIQQTNQDLINRCNKVKNDLSISNNMLSLLKLPIGSVTTYLIKSKFTNNYNLNFNLSPNQTGGSFNDMRYKIEGIIGWKNAIIEKVMPFTESEDVDGWI